MKVLDILENDIRTQRLNRLRQDVVSNKRPVIHNVSSTADASIYTMGDLENLGWMTKRYTHDMEGEVDGWERDYDGPNPIQIQTTGAGKLRVLCPGETID